MGKFFPDAVDFCLLHIDAALYFWYPALANHFVVGICNLPQSNAKTLLQSLAQEEAKHKLRFEVEYDDVILKEN